MDLTLLLYLLSLRVFGVVSKDEDQEKLNCLEMRNHKWFKGNIKECVAEVLLLDKLNGEYIHPDGAFLVRDNFSNPGEYDMSVKVGETVTSFYILRDENGKYFLWDEKFDSVHDLIAYHRTSSVSQYDKIYLTDMAEMDQIEPTDDHLRNRNCLETQGWYKGDIDKNAAEELLLARIANKYVQPDGAFLVRESENIPGDYKLSVRLYVYFHNTRILCLVPTCNRTKRYVALYDFEPQECEELLLRKGDEIIVIDDNDPNWLMGRECRTYQTGSFPRTYVTELKKQN